MPAPLTKPKTTPTTTATSDLDALSDRELDVRIAEALRAVDDLHRQVADATARFNALHDERDRRSIRRRAAQ
jgi:hypothetical protein